MAGLVQPLPEGAAREGRLEGPRLSVQVAPTTDLRAALAGYREATAARYPPPALPDWVRHQWGSWWVYGSAVDEARVRAQIDVIATQLADLGPWHVLIDGGWQDTGRDATGDLGRPHPRRFPNGLRPLVDYAHARGIRVVLFFSPVYAHDDPGRGEWLALPGLLTGHPDWFRPLTPPGSPVGRFQFDYSRPGTRDYVAGVVRRMVEEHGADGIKLDGLGDVEGHLIPFPERAGHLPRRWALTPVMDVYRLVGETLRQARPEAFLESGWVNPAPAQALAHTFRYGDEWDVFDRAYPFTGLAQHFTYAAAQRSLLGQRPHVGAVFGGLNRPIADQWLGAALALGAQVSLGSDLTLLNPEGLASLRALLVHHRPFAGTTRTGPEHFGLRPTWAATTVGELTFAALLNESAAPRAMSLDLQAAGMALAPGAEALAYDVAGGRFSRVAGTLRAEVPAQTLRLFVLRRSPGVLWTTSGYDEPEAGQPGGGAILQVRLRGPRTVPGRLHLYLPGGPPGAVLLDGRPLPALPGDGAGTAPAEGGPAEDAGGPGEGYAYDAATGHLAVRYAHAGLAPPGASGERHPERTLELRP